MASSSETQKPNTEDILEEEANELVLYHSRHSYFCHTVLFAMYEKKLNFKLENVNLLKGDQYQLSFLKLNPKGEVPVLKDGVKIIPDSSRIIDYLEDNFSNGDTPRLKLKKGTPQFQTMERFNSLIDNISISTLTYGCFHYPELANEMMITPKEIALRLAAFETCLTQLDNLSEKHHVLKSVLNSKKEAVQKRQALAQDLDKVKKVLDDVGQLLDEVEKELETHVGDKENWYLCSEKLTIADINLATFLHRLFFLGLQDRYFSDGKHPKVALFYTRMKKRPAFHQTIYPPSGLLKCVMSMGQKERILVSIGSGVAILGIIVLATYLIRSKK